MANVLGDLFRDIATAIREQTGDTATMKPAEFPDKIRSIETGSGGSGGDTIIVDGVDPYYQQLAEALMTRDAGYLSDDRAVLSMKGFVASDGSTLASLQKYSFAGFTSVEGMEFSDVVMIQENALTGNSKLRFLDITVGMDINVCGFYPNSLSGCAALEAIIVRDGGGGISSVAVNVNHGSNDTFYIYVPADQYDTIVSAISDNALPASRFRKLEDYPKVNNWNKTFEVQFYDGDTLVDTKTVKYGETATTSYTKEGMSLVAWTPSPENVTENLKCYGEWDRAYSFATDSWADLAELAESGNAASKLSVGDTRNVTLTYPNGTTQNGVLEIIGFNHDDLSDGSGKAGITIEFKGVMTGYGAVKWYGTNSSSNVDFSESTIKPLYDNTIVSFLPDDIQAVIKLVSKKYTNVYNTAAKSYSCKLFPLAVSELGFIASSVPYDSDEGSVYEKYSGNTGKTKGAVYTVLDKNYSWWTRNRSNTGLAWYISAAGAADAQAQNKTAYLSFCFCI